MKCYCAVFGLGTLLVAGVQLSAWRGLSVSTVAPSVLVRFEQAALRCGGDLSQLPVAELRRTAPWFVDNKPIAAVCFAPDTPQEIVAAFMKTMYGEDGDLDYYLQSRWPGSNGAPLTLGWSFVPDGLSVDGAPSNLFAMMDSVAARDVWISRFQYVFDRWSDISGVTYTRVTYAGQPWDDGAAFGTSGSSTRGDIRISMRPQDGAGNVLAYNYYPTHGDMVLDSDDVAAYGDATNLHRFLRNVVAHEHGHGLGLRHVCPPNATKLLEPYIYTGSDGPRHDEFRAAQRYYGDHNGSNNSPTNATNLGTLTDPQTIEPCTTPPPVSGTNDTEVSICSMDSSGEQDYFKFSVAEGGTLTLIVLPRGKIYDNQPQGSEGECPAGGSFNSKQVADLAIDLIDTDGSTVLASASAQPLGQAEALFGVPLPGPGTFYVRVRVTGAQTQSQLYELSLSYACAPIVNSQPLTHLALPGASTTFTVAALGATSYQWFKDGTALSNDGRISGATSATLTLNPVTKTDSGAYYVEITNACDQRVSDEATLWLNGDCNCDGLIDFDDINAFVLLLSGCTGYHQVYPNCDCHSGDCNGDGSVNYGDVNLFVTTLIQ